MRNLPPACKPAGLVIGGVLATVLALPSMAPRAHADDSSDATRHSTGIPSVQSIGDNVFGQLGDATFVNRFTAVTVTGISEIVDLGRGPSANHGLAVLPNHTVKAWGINLQGQLGDGTTTNHPTPGTVAGITTATKVATGAVHSLAVLKDGTVRAWGDNSNGQLGDGTNADSSLPVQVSGIGTATAVAAGEFHSLALLRDGTVRAWGDNNFGQLGNGTNADSNVPVTVTGLTGVKAIAAGDDFSLALLRDGTVRTWGDNNFGQLGNGNAPTDSNVPVQVVNLSGVKAIAAGSDFAMALLRNGTVRAWGRNLNGQLGNGNAPTNSDVPVSVLGLTEVTVIAAGSEHGLAASATDKSQRCPNTTLYTWGDNEEGQLGDGTEDGKSVPGAVATGLATIDHLAGGFEYTLAAGDLSNSTCDESDKSEDGDGGPGEREDRDRP
ncbi:RCC1 domain-containing protein [Streptomyces wuyuanensis]|uniref:RCC1 domain-containing protein n=1 Tax=Streptomyces wuyuanensis TaxID=1196353 RepID=UPI00379A8FE6